MGNPLVIARANSAVLQRILQLVGAHQIINPEQEFGKRFANRLLYNNVIVDTALGEDLQLTEICVLPSMVGKNLIELSLPKRFGVMVAAIRKGKSGRIQQPVPDVALQENDHLVIVSNESAIPRLIEGA
jgi:trk system potassium uptake protein TrkA